MILDCTDHPSSRYLVSDAAVLTQKPLVSASALQTNGQLMVLNNPSAAQGHERGGPCYRCVFPKPPPPETVVSCGEGGILGPVVGLMGVLQALETVKLLVSSKKIQQASPNGSIGDTSAIPQWPAMLIFSAFDEQPLRIVRLRARRKDCKACSSASTITRESLASGSTDYIQFCGVPEPVETLTPGERLTPTQLHDDQARGEFKCLLVDTREKPLFDLYSIPGSVNIPFSDIAGWRRVEDANRMRDEAQAVDRGGEDAHPNGRRYAPIHVICQLGNDSQIAVRRFKDLGLHENGLRFIADIIGGWRAWKDEVPGDWPEI